MQIKNDKLPIRRNLNILKWVCNCIVILTLIFTTLYVKANKILVLAIIIVAYVNMILLIKFLINSMRVGLTWRNVEECIQGIESGSESIEDIQNKLIGNDEYRYSLGKQYGKILEATKKILDNVAKSVENINKNEKMNIELVNNVTNKLDKPLESILENVENLKIDKCDKEAIKNLKYKSNNMRVLIDELFEAAKVSSGDINILTERIEISALLKQAVIEYKDNIYSSNIIYKVNIPKDKVYINCNGEKMWRVFDILIQNTLKHSLAGSRVYIDLLTNKDKVYIKIRNTSKEELNIGADELINIINNNKAEDRSGLGLDIAKNLVILQNGEFNLDIQADLFSIQISFPIDMEESEEDDK